MTTKQSEDDIDVRQAIIDLRGGVPAKCDFCNKEVAQENLHPEEAGMWACIDCINRWYREDKKQDQNFKAGYDRALSEIVGILMEYKVDCVRCRYALEYISKRRAENGAGEK